MAMLSSDVGKDRAKMCLGAKMRDLDGPDDINNCYPGAQPCCLPCLWLGPEIQGWLHVCATCAFAQGPSLKWFNALLLLF